MLSKITKSAFDFTRFNTKSKTFQTLVRQFLNADDSGIVSPTEKDMQAVIALFSKAYTAFELTIILKEIRSCSLNLQASLISNQASSSSVRLEVSDSLYTLALLSPKMDPSIMK